MDTLYTFWDNITHYKTESTHVLGLMNSATKLSGGSLTGSLKPQKGGPTSLRAAIRRCAARGRRPRPRGAEMKWGGGSPMFFFGKKSEMGRGGVSYLGFHCWDSSGCVWISFNFLSISHSLGRNGGGFSGFLTCRV